jgi:hypothetical protein
MPRTLWTEEDDAILRRYHKLGFTFEAISARLQGRSGNACNMRAIQLGNEGRVEAQLPPERVPQQQRPWTYGIDSAIRVAANLGDLKGDTLQRIAQDSGGRSHAEIMERYRFLKQLNSQEHAYLVQLQAVDPNRAHNWYERWRWDVAEERDAARCAVMLYRQAHPDEDNNSEGMQQLVQLLRQTVNSSDRSNRYFW